MNRVKKVSKLWQQQRPAVLAERERRRRLRRTRRSLETAKEARRD